VNRSRAIFESKTRVGQVIGNEWNGVRVTLQSALEAKMRKWRMEEIVQRRTWKHPEQLHFLIEQIEELNARLKALGADDSELADAEELHSEMLPDSGAGAQQERETENVTEEQV
jgi:hypothetical protein